MLKIDLNPDGGLCVHIPGAQGYTVNIPLTVDGVATLRHLLQQRQIFPDATIGHHASPTQQMIDAFVNEHGVTRTTPEQDELLERVGDIEL